MSYSKRQDEIEGARIISRAKSNARNRICPFGCESGQCNGFSDTLEISQMALQYQRAMKGLRDRHGWVQKRMRMKDNDGNPTRLFWYHFVEKKPIQLDIKTGKILKFIGTINIGGNPIEFQEVCARG